MKISSKLIHNEYFSALKIVPENYIFLSSELEVLFFTDKLSTVINRSSIPDVYNHVSDEFSLAELTALKINSSNWMRAISWLSDNVNQLNSDLKSQEFNRNFLHFSYTPVDVNEIGYYIILKIDTSDHAGELLARASTFKAMIEDTQVLISVIDKKGQIQYFNPAWENLTGWKVNQKDNLLWDRLIHKDDVEKLMIKLDNSIRLKVGFQIQIRILDLSGKYLWFDITGTVRFDSGGDFDGYICMGINITESVSQLQKLEILNTQLDELNVKLSHSEEKLQSAFDAADLGSCSLDLITGRAEMSPTYRRHYGLPLTGEIDWNMVTQAVEPDYLEEVIRVQQEARDFGTPVDSTYPILDATTGEKKWMRVKGKVKRNKYGEPESVYAVVMDVTERKLNDERKSDFFTMISHELKTPMTSIGAYVQYLEKTLQDKDDVLQNKMFERINRQLKKMTGLINSFLDLSRLEDGKLLLEAENFDFIALISELAEEFSTVYPSRVFEVLTDQDTVFINGDINKLSHVISNFLSNAVKYSAARSKVVIRCETIDEKIVFSVIDQGIGLSSEDIPKIFDRYYQASNYSSINASGFGIGLYLCSEIIKLHQGEIWLNSELGRGTEFFFSLTKNSN
ncbi:ATP-binding protein [Pedobacter sp. AW1-32]|uniref:PAS domain-containing sensor histidine kinase n=1 Tax=Pedobacter sp. AW1-32 TaxID=3383026 RepID=UPI003FEF7884